MSEVLEYKATEDTHFNGLFVEKGETVKALEVQMKYLYTFERLGAVDEPVTTADQPKVVDAEAVAPITAALKTRGFTATSSNPA